MLNGLVKFFWMFCKRYFDVCYVVNFCYVVDKGEIMLIVILLVKLFNFDVVDIILIELEF